MIEKARLYQAVDSTITTGDLDYEGTAMEVVSDCGEEIFHVVVDRDGQRQVLFFRSDFDFRLPLEVLEEVIQKAKREIQKSC